MHLFFLEVPFVEKNLYVAQSRIHLRTILLYVVRKSDFELYKSRTNFHSFLYNLEEIIYTVSLYNKIWV